MLTEQPVATGPLVGSDSTWKLDQMRWRHVGPPRGGRVVAVAGDPTDRATYWMGACAGGVWRTTDGGQYWRPMGDGQFSSSSVGAIAVAESDAAVVWVGTGETQARNNVVPGDGVYRSTDGGRRWQHLGLAETRHISRIRVHPRDPDIAWVGALGDVFADNPERGVYRTTDGGGTWERVLHLGDDVGVADLSLDPCNPRILYAAMWEARRSPWDMKSGGERSGLWRSTDGGDTWDDLAMRPGFASGPLGRIGVSASAAKAGRVFAIVEAGDDAGGMYRSDDHGDTWTHVSTERGIQGRPWYYSHVFAHPTEPDTVWSLNLWAHRSTDGGRTWDQIQTPHGDNHDLWIDPADPRRMATGNDGGAAVSLDGGFTWSDVYNQSTVQIYRFDVNPAFPHDLYATQQDNSGIRTPSRSWKGGIRWWDGQELGEAEAGDVALDPLDDRYVYLGGAGFGHPGPLLRFDTVTEQAFDVAVWPEYNMGEGASQSRHRFGWTFPIEFSPHDPGCLYAAGECLFRSDDRGMSWRAISPDLTRNDATKLGPSGGPISMDTTGAEVYCTIHAFAESPSAPGELWVGTDDGLVHVSRDGGAVWSDVTPPELPEWATVQRIDVSRHAPGRAYLAAHAYRVGDRRPYLMMTHDFGATWESISHGLGDDDWARTIREDPVVETLLFAGTEHHAWASIDRGRTWFVVGARLPDVPIYDLKIREHELIAGTHGRGFWILDDVTPLRYLATRRAGALGDDELVVLHPPPARRYPTPNGWDMPGDGIWVGGFPGVPIGGMAFTPETDEEGNPENVVIFGGTNPPDGAALRFFVGRDLASADGESATLRVTDPGGMVVRTVLATAPPGQPAERVPLRLRPGVNLFAWDLRIDGVAGLVDDDGERSWALAGPRVPPGQYTVEFQIGDATGSTTVDVRRDPRHYATDDDLAVQYKYLVAVRDVVERLMRTVETSRRTARHLRDWDRPEMPDAVRVAARDLAQQLADVDRRLNNADIVSHGDALKMPAGLDAKLILLPEIVVELSDTRPTESAQQVRESLTARAATALDEIDALLGAPLAQVEELIRSTGTPLIPR